MFRKIILVILLVIILFVGYRLIKPAENTKIVHKEAQAVEHEVYVYAINVQRGQYLTPEMVKPKTTKKQNEGSGQKSVITGSVDIPYQQNPVMKISRMQGTVVSREDFALPGDADYLKLLHNKKYTVYAFEVYQRSLTDYIAQGDHVDIYALTSANKSASDFYGEKAKLNPAKDKFGLERLVSNAIVSGIESKGDSIFSVSVLVPTEQLGKVTLADKFANIQIVPHLKDIDDGVTNVLNNMGFNNVREYRGKGEEN